MKTLKQILSLLSAVLLTAVLASCTVNVTLTTTETTASDSQVITNAPSVTTAETTQAQDTTAEVTTAPAETDPPASAHTLVGHWAVYGNPFNNSFTFTESGTGYYVIMAEPFGFTYTVDGDTLTIVYDEAQRREVYTVIFNGERVTLTDEDPDTDDFILDRI